MSELGIMSELEHIPWAFLTSSGSNVPVALLELNMTIGIFDSIIALSWSDQ